MKPELQHWSPTSSQRLAGLAWNGSDSSSTATLKFLRSIRLLLYPPQLLYLRQKAQCFVPAAAQPRTYYQIPRWFVVCRCPPNETNSGLGCNWGSKAHCWPILPGGSNWCDRWKFCWRRASVCSSSSVCWSISILPLILHVWAVSIRCRKVVWKQFLFQATWRCIQSMARCLCSLWSFNIFIYEVQ